MHSYKFAPPIFNIGKNGAATDEKVWANSVYYWWWRYLRANPIYAKICAGEDVEFPQVRKAYEIFGNVQSGTFRQWWFQNNRGPNLFSEQDAQTNLTVLDNGKHEFIINRNNPCIYVRVPKYEHTRKQLKKAFEEILHLHHKTTHEAKRTKHSNAKFVVLGKPKIDGLRKALQVWEYYLTHPELTHWELAYKSGVHTFTKAHEKNGVDMDERRQWNVDVSRYLTKAENLLNNVIFGRFPDYAVRVKGATVKRQKRNVSKRALLKINPIKYLNRH